MRKSPARFRTLSEPGGVFQSADSAVTQASPLPPGNSVPGAIRSSSSVTLNSTASAFFPVVFLIMAFCSGVSSSLTFSLGFDMGLSPRCMGPGTVKCPSTCCRNHCTRESGAALARALEQGARGDPLFQLRHAELDRCCVLAGGVLDDRLLL